VNGSARHRNDLNEEKLRRGTRITKGCRGTKEELLEYICADCYAAGL